MPKLGGRLTALHVFTGTVILLGCAVLLSGIIRWESEDLIRTSCFLLLSLIASGLRLKVSQIVGTMSVSFVFILLGILELSLSESLLMGCASSVVQVLVHRHQPRLRIPALFHVSTTAIAITIAYKVYHSPWTGSAGTGGSLVSLAVAATILFAMNTFPLAAAYTLAEKRNLAWVWRECNFRTFPFYLVGAFVASLFHFSNQWTGMQSPLLLVPVAFVVYSSYHSYVGRVTAQNSHVEGMAALHLRTIEALALAIEAKDMTAQNHLRRLQLYCAEIGNELGLAADEMEALRAAAVLHDIGKLAVPEHILSKPGKLTREEFEKVKIHPLVGAEILERVNFPYPVARLVRSHHEKWNGGGYPHGLKGEAIPMGARILAAVDCLDALVSDRPYRAAMRLEEAMNRIVAEAGVSFDPAVIRIIHRRYQELEARLKAQTGEPRPSYERDVATEIFFPSRPAEHTVASGETQSPMAESGPGKPAFLDTIAAARQEAQILLELTQELGSSLHLDQTLSVLGAGLRRIVPFEAFIVYVVAGDDLIPRYASGECTSLFLSRHIPMGAGIAGWVASHKKPILNGNPTLEMGATSESMRGILLNSALAVPLPGLHGSSGVLMACRRGFDAFTKDNLRILMAVTSKLGSVIENAIKYEQAAASASTDFLTGLPNARALHQQLESELSRCRRLGGSLTVLVTDLDGFKEINDRFGHLEGNTILRTVSKSLRDNCREYDYVARMGGDEFVLILPGLAEEDVLLKIAQFNRTVMEDSKKVIPESNLSLSVGQARFPNDGDDPERLLAEADQRMYQAKVARKLKSHRGVPRGYDFDWSESTSSLQ